MKVLFRADEIAERVKQLGKEISEDYQDRDLVMVGVLKGGFMFLSDLVRQIDLPMQLDFARVSSYTDSYSPAHEVKIMMDVETNIRKKDVLMVDDILDTGQSMHVFKAHLARKSPASLKVCTLIDKTFRRSAPITPDFFGFRIKDGFIVGYGLDYAEKYRSLPDIYVLNPENGR
jgi:hypoxanthine phosphoribosyltransferase